MQTDRSAKIFMPWLWVTTVSISLGSTVGSVAGERFGFPLGDVVEQTLHGFGLDLSGGYVPSMIAGFVNGLVAGIIIGFLQWLILQNYVKRAGWWILLTMAGSAIASLIASAIFNFFMNAFDNTWLGFLVGFSVAGLVRGVCIGVPQWLVFAGRFENSFWWIVVSAIAWSIGDVAFAFLYSLLLLFGDVHLLWETILGAISGLLVGAITGLVLVFLLNQSHPAREEKGETTPYMTSS